MSLTDAARRRAEISKGSNFLDRRSDFFPKTVETQTETILHIVSKFQVDRTEKKRVQNSVAKWNNMKEERLEHPHGVGWRLHNADTITISLSGALAKIVCLLGCAWPP